MRTKKPRMGLRALFHLEEIFQQLKERLNAYMLHFYFSPGISNCRGNMGVMAENKPKEKPCNKRTTTLLTEFSNRQETKIKFFFSGTNT